MEIAINWVSQFYYDGNKKVKIPLVSVMTGIIFWKAVSTLPKVQKLIEKVNSASYDMFNYNKRWITAKS